MKSFVKVKTFGYFQMFNLKNLGKFMKLVDLEFAGRFHSMFCSGLWVWHKPHTVVKKKKKTKKRYKNS